MNVHLTMAHMKLEIRVSQNLVRLKGKGRQKKTNKQTRKQKNNKKKKTMFIVALGG